VTDTDQNDTSQEVVAEPVSALGADIRNGSVLAGAEDVVSGLVPVPADCAVLVVKRGPNAGSRFRLGTGRDRGHRRRQPGRSPVQRRQARTSGGGSGFSCPADNHHRLLRRQLGLPTSPRPIPPARYRITHHRRKLRAAVPHRLRHGPACSLAAQTIPGIPSTTPPPKTRTLTPQHGATSPSRRPEHRHAAAGFRGLRQP
jgi:hypothetical protein